MTDDRFYVPVDFGDSIAEMIIFAEQSIRDYARDDDETGWAAAWKEISELLTKANGIYEESGLMDR